MRKILCVVMAAVLLCACAVPAAAVAIEPEEIFVEPDPAMDPTTGFDSLPSADPSLIPIDFDEQQAENPDIYAWITIPDTIIDYPVLQSARGVDKDYYLDHTPEGQEGYPGSVYSENDYNSHSMTDRVTILYGHNMSYGAIFGTLKLYHDEAYRQAHPQIIIYTPEHVFTYQIVFTVTYDDRLIPAYFDLETQEGYEEFIQSLSTVGTDPTWIDDTVDLSSVKHMLVLSTCNGNKEQRYLVGAMLTDIQ